MLRWIELAYNCTVVDSGERSRGPGPSSYFWTKVKPVLNSLSPKNTNNYESAESFGWERASLLPLSLDPPLLHPIKQKKIAVLTNYSFLPFSLCLFLNHLLLLLCNQQLGLFSFPTFWTIHKSDKLFKKVLSSIIIIETRTSKTHM